MLGPLTWTVTFPLAVPLLCLSRWQSLSAKVCRHTGGPCRGVAATQTGGAGAHTWPTRVAQVRGCGAVVMGWVRWRVAEVVACAARWRHLWDMPRGMVLRRVVMLLGGQVAAMRVVVLPGEQAIVCRVTGDNTRRGRGGGRGRGWRGQVRVGDVVRASVKSQGRLGEGRMQGLRRDVGAPQAAKQCVIHCMQTHTALQERWEGQVNKANVTKSTKNKITSAYPSCFSFSSDYSKTSPSVKKFKIVRAESKVWFETGVLW